MRVSELFQAPAPIAVTLHNGGVVNVQRRPWSTVTQTELNEVARADDEDWHSFRARQILIFLAEWDVENEEGHKVPPSHELLCQMDLRDILAIDEAIGADFLPSRRTTNPPSEEPSLPGES